MSPLGFELDEIYLFATRRIQIQDIEQQQVKVNHREAKQCVEPIFIFFGYLFLLHPWIRIRMDVYCVRGKIVVNLG